MSKFSRDLSYNQKYSKDYLNYYNDRYYERALIRSDYLDRPPIHKSRHYDQIPFHNDYLYYRPSYKDLSSSMSRPVYHSNSYCNRTSHGSRWDQYYNYYSGYIPSYDHFSSSYKNYTPYRALYVDDYYTPAKINLCSSGSHRRSASQSYSGSLD